jgi:DNA-binding Lrp family transcriptional regulator
MVSAIVLIHAERDRINEIAEALGGVKGIAEVYSVAGEWDLVAIVRVADNDAMSDIVTKRMLKVKGITKTTTLIAFKAYSKHDLERMFSIGT